MDAGMNLVEDGAGAYAELGSRGGAETRREAAEAKG